MRTGAEDDATGRRDAALCFLVGLALYLPAIGWGLAHATAPDRVYVWGSDELAPLGAARELHQVFLADAPRFNPQYPLFHYAVQAVFVGPWILAQWVASGGGPITDAHPFGLDDPVGTLRHASWLARIPSLLMAAGIVVAAYWSGREMGGRRSGLVTAALVASLPPLFYYGRTSNVDVPALFWVALATPVALRALRDGLTPARGAWIGVAAALATGTKDASWLVFLAFGATLAGAGALRALRSPEAARALALFLAAFVGTGAAAYALASGWLLHPGRFARHVEFILASTTAYRYPPTGAGYAGLLQETVLLASAAVGLPLALLALAGLARLRQEPWRVALLALPVAAVVLGSIVPVRFVFFRFLLLPAFFLALLGAWVVARGLASERLGVRRAAVAALALALLWNATAAADLTVQSLGDSRYQVADWFRRHGRPGDRVGHYGATQKLPHLEAGITTLPIESLCTPEDWSGPEAPEFVLVIPQQHFEIEREWSLAEAVWEGLDSGRLGYVRVLRAHGPGLWSRTAVSFVNPPVQVFARSDRAGTLPPDAFHLDPPAALLAPLEAALGLGPRVPPGLERNLERNPESCRGEAS